MLLPNVIDKMDDLDIWLGELAALAIDTEALTPVRDARARMNVLVGYASRFHTEPGIAPLAQRLANDPGEYDVVVQAVLTASIAHTEGVLDTVDTAFSEAQTICIHEAVAKFRTAARGPLIDHLSVLLAATLADVAAHQLPPGVLSLEAATRSGVSDDYLALEQAHAKYNGIGSLLASWRNRKISDHALVIQHPERLAAVPSAPGGVWLALALAAGAVPGILTGAEADVIRDRADTGTREAIWATQDATQLAQEQAAEAARHYTHPVPDRRYMPGAAARVS